MAEESAIPTKQESIAATLVPYRRDDPKALYLGCLACGFSIREALKHIKKAKSTLSLWRKDQKFVELENNVPSLRKTLGIEYANLEFLRNYRLVLEKDFRVITKSLDKTQVLTKHEQDYLLKMRSHYTPQQLQIIEAIVMADTSGKGFNFTEAVISFFQEQRGMKVEFKGSPKSREITGSGLIDG
jgi:hypothetical protein